MPDDKLLAWFDKQSTDQRPIIDAVFAAVNAATDSIECAVKWGHPTWSNGGPICQVKPSKKHVGLVFWWGAKLADPAGLLTGSGTTMRTAKFTCLADVQPTAIADLVQAGLAANRTFGDPTRTKV
jgi:hypothetical protein